MTIHPSPPPSVCSQFLFLAKLIPEDFFTCNANKDKEVSALKQLRPIGEGDQELEKRLV
jgi:hypothetical protein